MSKTKRTAVTAGHPITEPDLPPSAAEPSIRQEAATATSPKHFPLVLAGLMLVLILAALDQSIVNTALPRMANDLGGLSHLSWIVTGFMLTSTVSTPLYGKLSDVYGRRRLLTISILLFLAASMLCGIAGSMTQLVLFRALQGLGAGGLVTLSQTVVAELVGPRQRGRYQGLFTGALAISNVAGPLIGGFLTVWLSWRWVFYVNLPVGIVALLLIMSGLPARQTPKAHRIDYVGAFWLIIGTSVLLLLLNSGGLIIPWWSLRTGLFAILVLVSAGLFVRQERRATEPLVDLHLFRNHSFLVGVLASGTMAFAMTGALVFLPLYFQLVLGMDPTHSGLMMLPQIAAMIVSGVGGGRLATRLGRSKPLLVCGVALECTALASICSLVWFGAGPLAFAPIIAMLGTGMGIGMPNATVIVQGSVERGALGVATAAMSFVRSLGGAFGVALSSAVMLSGLKSRLHSISPDAKMLIDHTMSALSKLPSDQQHEVLIAYRQAIAGSVGTSAVIMFAALMFTLTIRSGE